MSPTKQLTPGATALAQSDADSGGGVQTTAKQSPADKQIAQHVYDKLTADGVDRRHPRCDQSGGSDDSGTGREQPAEWLSHWEAQSSFTKTDRYFERRLQRG